MASQPNEQRLDYEQLIETPDFKHLMKRKSKFTISYVIFFSIIFFTLPILTSYTSILEIRAVGWMTWTWVYAFSLFIMVWLLTSIYMKKAKEFDKDIEKILQKHVVK